MNSFVPVAGRSLDFDSLPLENKDAIIVQTSFYNPKKPNNVYLFFGIKLRIELQGYWKSHFNVDVVILVGIKVFKTCFNKFNNIRPMNFRS